jgi:hypothetical protein
MPVNPTVSNGRSPATKRVAKARKIVDRRRRLIAEIRLPSSGTVEAEKLLAIFERSLAIFEDDLVNVEEVDE